MKNKHANGSAFSLLELLVTVTLIALLASLLFGAISIAKKRAREAACQNNLRQIGLGISEFLGDFHVYPLAYNRRGIRRGLYPEHGLDWYEALNLHYFDLPFAGRRPSDGIERVPTSGVWNCPSSRRPTAWDENPNTKGWLWVDYGYNNNGLGNHPDASLGLGRISVPRSISEVGYRPTAEGDVAAPVKMIAAGDGILGWGTVFTDGSDDLAVGKRATSLQRFNATKRVEKRHSGRANVVFCDGHVEAIKLDSLFSVSDSASMARWNKDNRSHPEMLY